MGTSYIFSTELTGWRRKMVIRLERIRAEKEWVLGLIRLGMRPVEKINE